MFRLLALVATTLAAPQYPVGYYPSYAGYPGMVYPSYAPISYNPIYQRNLYQPLLVPQAMQTMQASPVAQHNTRAFFGAGALQEINGRMVEQTAATTLPTLPAVASTTATQEITGTVQLTQNALTNVLYNNDAQYKIYVQRSVNDLTGQNIIVALGADCLTIRAVPTAPTAADPNPVSS